MSLREERAFNSYFKYSMRILSKNLYFLILSQLSNCLPTQCPHGQGVGAVSQRTDRHGQWKGGGLKLAEMCGRPLRMALYDAAIGMVQSVKPKKVGAYEV